MSITTVTCLPPLPVHWDFWQQATLTEEYVTVFRLKTTSDSYLLNQWETLLTPTEQQRATKFRQRADQHRFTFGRALIRLITSQITKQFPQHVRIERGYAGKPFLADLPNWHFSVSHTGEWVILVVGCVPVGIDIEFINRRFLFDDLIPTVLTATEQLAMTDSPDAHLFFYECWTRKEAFVKATGAGMTDNFMNVPSLEGTHYVDSQLIGERGSWTVQPFFVDDSYPAALASESTEGAKSLCFYEIDPASLSQWINVR